MTHVTCRLTAKNQDRQTDRWKAEFSITAILLSVIQMTINHLIDVIHTDWKLCDPWNARLIIILLLCCNLQPNCHNSHLFCTWQKLENFFTYIRPKGSRSIRYNSMYLILACVESFCSYSDIKHFYQSNNEIDDYCLVFIVSISLLRKILNACQN